jgi:hypothetical protein
VTVRATQHAILTVVYGADHRTAGFMLSRGRQGIEAFDALERSLGLFETSKLAHAALMVEMVPPT